MKNYLPLLVLAMLAEKTGEPNIKGLGKKQKLVLKDLRQPGFFISVFVNYSEGSTRHCCITDHDDSWIFDIPFTWVEALCNRNLLIEKSVYSTVQPDTENFEYHLKDEVKKLLTT